MKTFLSETLHKIIGETSFDFAQTTFVLPSKRAGSFLKELIKTETSYSGFSPEVLSIEDFIAKITGLRPLDNMNTLFRFYESYRQLTPQKEQEDFNTFYGWAQTLIYDFNEIDRYLIDTQAIFQNLSYTENIENWTPEDRNEPTTLVKNYLNFWEKLPEYHHHLVQALLKNNEAYQGLIYRQAAQQIESYLENHTTPIIFIGFNALNKAEKIIIQAILHQNSGQIFWDIDHHFLDNPYHKAGHFMRQYKNWPHYKEQKKEFKSPGNHFKTPKTITSIGIPKNIGQAKYIGELLKEYSPEKLQNTALVLNEEGLLSPVLNSFPSSIRHINITMGLPLGMTPLASLFELLFTIQEDHKETFYYKLVQEVLSHPFIAANLGEESQQLQQSISEKNLVFLNSKEILNLTKDRQTALILSLCFSWYKNDIHNFLSALIQLNEKLGAEKEEKSALALQYLYRFDKLFKQLQNLLEKYRPYTESQFKNVNTIKGLHRIYKDLLQTESLDFEGSPFEGIQLMGMLETRGLDYETVILTSVNEGILPAGKSTNSYIPFDLKKHFGLPTYTDKDAVYTYHFYRLLQRAKNVYLLYNTDQSGFNSGEKSRFIRQLEIEEVKNHTLNALKVNWQVQTPKKEIQQIKKTEQPLSRLKQLACRETAHQLPKGFSPSALTTYIRNPIEFYKKYVLGIKDHQEVEETIAPNTLGTVVHETLEKFYKPYAKKEDNTPQKITPAILDKMTQKVSDEVEKQFAKVYQDAPLNQGKNRIIREIAKHYIQRFLSKEKEKIDKKELIILHIEDEDLSYKLDIPELDFPVYISGKVDRVDKYGDNIQVLDYKTGSVEASELKLNNWEQLLEDKKYNKAFQVLCYALLLHKTKGYNEFEAGIISFKKMNKGFLKLKVQKDKDSKKVSAVIDKTVLDHFEQKLIILIKEIFNPEIPFKEKEA